VWSSSSIAAAAAASSATTTAAAAAAAFGVQRTATGVADTAAVAVVSPSIAGHRSAGHNSSARVVTTTTWSTGGRWRRRKKCRRVSPASFPYYTLPSVYYHGVNGESLGGDAPRRRRRRCHHRRRRRRRRHHRDLGDSGEFRNRLRPGSGREHRQLDETTGESLSLPYARHEGSDGIRGGHGIIIIITIIIIIVITLFIISPLSSRRDCAGDSSLDVVRHFETAPASSRRARQLRAVASCRWPG